MLKLGSEGKGYVLKQIATICDLNKIDYEVLEGFDNFIEELIIKHNDKRYYITDVVILGTSLLIKVGEGCDYAFFGIKEFMVDLLCIGE